MGAGFESHNSSAVATFDVWGCIESQDSVRINSGRAVGTGCVKVSTTNRTKHPPFTLPLCEGPSCL